MSKHTFALVKEIRIRAIKQYWLPFSNIKLDNFSAQMNLSITELQDLLVELIKSNNIDARIDDYNKVPF